MKTYDQFKEVLDVLTFAEWLSIFDLEEADAAKILYEEGYIDFPEFMKDEND